MPKKRKSMLILHAWDIKPQSFIRPPMLHPSLMVLLPDCFRSLVGIFSVTFPLRSQLRLR